MRKLYEINQDIEALLDAVTDPETGEIVDMDCLEGLFIEREKKLEHVALYGKNIRAEKNAVKAEIDELTKRYKRLSRSEEGVEMYLEKALNGERFSTGKVDCTFRESESADVDPEFIEWAYAQDTDMSGFIKHKESDEPDKMAIKKFLKQGGKLEYCRLVKKKNLTIK